MYSKHKNDELILRDKLAIGRNIMANERTLLAYLSAGITLIIAGVTIIKFFLSGYFGYFGVFLSLVGVFFILFGIKSYKRRKKEIEILIKKEKN